MDRLGADFQRAVDMIRDRLGAVPVPLQIPIGSEDSFVGVVDLVEMRAFLFEGERGIDTVRKPIPAELVPLIQRWVQDGTPPSAEALAARTCARAGVNPITGKPRKPGRK